MIATISNDFTSCRSVLELKGLGNAVRHAKVGGRNFFRHANKDGSVGGFVESTAKVIDSAYIGINAIVHGNALVSENAGVYDNAEVFGKSWVRGNARVFGNAKVYGFAQVCGNARVYDDARVFGNSEVFEDANVFDTAKIFQNASVHGNSEIGGNSEVCGNACLMGYTRLYNEKIWKATEFEQQWQLDFFLENVKRKEEMVRGFLKRG
ncbi:MAG: hypothetical protein KGH49_03090 [Candidatus Micrarchaeota archaeon]|nr:hypothetical protein [Candidatus Micrarchaeota archaeon]